MRYLLDTNICVYIINKRPEKVFTRFRKCGVGEVGISAITFSELRYGVSRSSRPDRNQAALNQFLGPLEILDFYAEVAPIYGEIRAALQASGRVIGPLDMLIGAHALFLNCTLVTNNEREFCRIPELRVENWA